MDLDNDYPSIESLTDEELKQLYELKLFRSLEEVHNWRDGKIEFICLKFEDQNFTKHSFSMLLDYQPIVTSYHNSKIPEEQLITRVRYSAILIIEHRLVEKLNRTGICPQCGYHFKDRQDIIPHLHTHGPGKEPQ